MSGRPLRVLQLVQQPQRRGAEIFALLLSRALRAGGHSVRTAYLYESSATHPIPLGPGDHILCTAASYGTDRYLGVSPRLLLRLLSVIDAYGPDIVQLNGARTVKYGALARWLRPRAHWRVVYRNIGDAREWWPAGARGLLFRALLSRIDGAVVLHEAGRAALRSAYPAARWRCTVIPRAVDPEYLQPERTRTAVRHTMQADPDQPVVLYVGSFTPEKRVDLLLDAFALLLRRVPRALLWLAGEGPCRVELQDRAQERGCGASLRFAGVQRDVGGMMAAADVLALTSDTEGMPGVILEAAMMGLPAVATRVGGVAACVRDGETGLLVQRGDVPAVARGLELLISDPARRSALGSAAQAFARSYFSMAVVAPRYASFYRELLAG